MRALDLGGCRVEKRLVARFSRVAATEVLNFIYPTLTVGQNQKMLPCLGLHLPPNPQVSPRTSVTFLMLSSTHVSELMLSDLRNTNYISHTEKFHVIAIIN